MLLLHVMLLTPPCHPHVLSPLLSRSKHLDTPQHIATLLSMLKMAQQLALAEAELQTQLQQVEQQDQLVMHLVAQHEVQHASQCPAAVLAAEAELERTHMRALAAAQRIVPPAVALLQAARPSHVLHSQPEANQELGLAREVLQLFEQMHEAAAKQQSGTWEFMALAPGLVSSRSSGAHEHVHMNMCTCTCTFP